MQGASPLSVTAVTQQLKRDPVYANVDDEATLILTYPEAQAIVQGPWNWPNHRKDLEIFGTQGHCPTPNAKSVHMRLRGQEGDRRIPLKGLPGLWRWLCLPRRSRRRHRKGVGYRSFVVVQQPHCGAYSRGSPALRAHQADNQP